MNPYELCAQNKVVENSQLMVMFHTDDLMIAHKMPNVVTDLI